MIWNKKGSIVLYILGFMLFIFVGCNSSAKEINDKETVYTSEKEIEKKSEPIESPASTTESKPINITSEQFIKLVSDYSKEWKYKGTKPCVIDFYADWCRPCKMMEPAFAKMAEKYSGEIDFYKINIDYSQGIADAYQVMGIPTLFFCSMDGKLIRVVGYQTEEQIGANLEMIMSK